MDSSDRLDRESTSFIKTMQPLQQILVIGPHEPLEPVKILILNGAAIMNTRDYLHLLNYIDLFNRFDEVWLYYRMPASRIFNSSEQAEVIIETAETIFERRSSDVDPFITLFQEMQAVGCVLGIADGCGLNVVCSNNKLSLKIIEVSGESLPDEFDFENY